MDIRLAGPEDAPDLARLLWLHAAPDEQAAQSPKEFVGDLTRWCAEHRDSHVAFLARLSNGEAVGMAWLGLLPRVPRPGASVRVGGDIQSVFVLPEHRGRGIGTALVQRACEHAERVGAARVTVHSSRAAIPVYEWLGFAASRQLLIRPPDG